MRICDNENFADSLLCHMDFGGSPVIVTSTALFEAGKFGYDYDTIKGKISSRLSADIRYQSITTEQHEKAKKLEDAHRALHPGDSDILAFAKAENATLVTCDKGLANVASCAKCKCVNPDTLPCDASSGRRFMSRVSRQLRKSQLLASGSIACEKRS